ncbi:MAG TPA: flagellar biosynthesis protein FliQ [Pirellulales bacterium]|jgi:flagellar biosynthetic protein FliQ|nr:flagellar biosynthesis protein FliQ [Pirellulales bacterium]
MEVADAVDLGRQAVMMSLLISAPVLIAGLVVGLLVGLLQALTQVQEQTVAFVPKLAAMIAVLAFSLPWLLEQMLDYIRELYLNIPEML